MTRPVDPTGVVPAGFTAEGRYDPDSPHRPGAAVTDGGVRFEVWAPSAGMVDVVLDPDGAREVHPLACPDPGELWATWSTTVAGAGHGTRYRFRITDGSGVVQELADPASRHQPEGVFGPSAVVDPERLATGETPTGADRRGPGLEGPDLDATVLYELHVGTFTPEGTLDSAAAQLQRLADLGVTTVELMPLAQFSGGRGWGYDGVFPNAVQHSYGGPEALARFVEAAHGLGLAVVLDVVYNHFGPEGNVTGAYGPYVTDTYATPWGGAMNLSGPGSDQVRRLFLDNVRWWIRDLGLDGLRLDAVHAIVDPTARPFLEEVTTLARSLGERGGRRVHTFLESSDNDPRSVIEAPTGLGGDAVWNDEYHHSLRVAVGGERSGYYEDFSGTDDVAEVLEHRWCMRGRWSSARGRRHGRDPVGPDGGLLPARRFVVFGQNHDQIGNRRDGERLDVLVGPEQRKLVLAAVLLSPFTPMLFMGEEYGETAPFPYFVDHSDPDLLEAVRRGRAAEFAAFGWEGEPPDPGSPQTAASAVLDPELSRHSPHRELLALTTELLRLRREHPVVRDTGADTDVVRASDSAGDTIALRRRSAEQSMLLALRFAPTGAGLDLGECRRVLCTAEDRWAGPGDGNDPTRGAGTWIPGWSALLALSPGD